MRDIAVLQAILVSKLGSANTCSKEGLLAAVNLCHLFAKNSNGTAAELEVLKEEVAKTIANSVSHLTQIELPNSKSPPVRSTVFPRKDIYSSFTHHTE